VDYRQLIEPIDLEYLKSINESGVNLAMTRQYGRVPRGELAVGAMPQNYGANVTMMAALSLRGVEAVMTIDGATDAEVFRAYLRLRSVSQPLQSWEYKGIPFKTETPLELVNAETAIVSFPFQHTKGHEAAGHVMQLRPLRAGLTAGQAELVLAYPNDLLDLGTEAL
jgi:DDE superfamily endonuclease